MLYYTLFANIGRKSDCYQIETQFWFRNKVNKEFLHINFILCLSQMYKKRERKQLYTECDLSNSWFQMTCLKHFNYIGNMSYFTGSFKIRIVETTMRRGSKEHVKITSHFLPDYRNVLRVHYYFLTLS